MLYKCYVLFLFHASHATHINKLCVYLWADTFVRSDCQALGSQWIDKFHFVKISLAPELFTLLRDFLPKPLHETTQRKPVKEKLNFWAEQ